MISKYPTFSYSNLNPYNVDLIRYNWSLKGTSLIYFSLKSTLWAYSKPLYIVEHISCILSFTKYFTV